MNSDDATYYERVLGELAAASQQKRQRPALPLPPRHWPPRRRRKPLAGRRTGNVLYLSRVLNGLTQQELADKSGVSRRTINAVENGRRTPTVYVAISIARALNLRVEDLFKVS